jgi:hypothetical protein
MLNTEQMMTKSEMKVVLTEHEKFWGSRFDSQLEGWGFGATQCQNIRDEAKAQLNCLLGKDGMTLDSVRSYDGTPITMEGVKKDYRKTLETIPHCDFQLKVQAQSVIVAKCGRDIMPKQMEKEMELLAELRSEFLMDSMELDATGECELSYHIVATEDLNEVEHGLKSKRQEPTQTGQTIRLMADKMKKQYEDLKTNYDIVNVIRQNLDYHMPQTKITTEQETEYNTKIMKIKEKMNGYSFD